MEIIRNLAQKIILGKPLILYAVLLTFVGVFVTAILGMLILKGKNIPIKIHVWVARTTVLIAALLGLLAVSLYI